MSEMQAILALPRVSPRADAVEHWTRELRRNKRAPVLLPGQAALFEALDYSVRAGSGPDGARGAMGVAGCGTGKTLFFQMAPLVADSHKPLLVMPANLRPQLMSDVERWNRHYKLTRPETLSYGKLSHIDSERILKAMRPDLIMLDEAHLLGDGARARRLWKYIAQYPETRVVTASGSFLDGKILPMALLSRMCLRDWSPFPIDDRILEQWSSVIDAGGEPDREARRSFAPMLAWANTYEPRKALFKRLKTAPGIAVTDGPLNVGVSLRMRRIEPVSTPELESLEKLWELPDGTELVDAIEIHRHRATLRLGFYYRYEPESVHTEWIEARRRWLGKLRALVEYGGYESPGLAERAIKRGAGPNDAKYAYRQWCAARASYDPPIRETVWTNTQILWDAVTPWLADIKPLEQGGCALWARSHAVRDYFEDTGIRVHWSGEKSTPPDNRGPMLVSTAWRRGWNGQAYNRALVLEPPTSARRMEQLIARHHRHGQLQDVEFTFYMSAFDHRRMTKRATMAHDVTGNPQRWVVGDWL